MDNINALMFGAAAKIIFDILSIGFVMYVLSTISTLKKEVKELKNRLGE